MRDRVAITSVCIHFWNLILTVGYCFVICHTSMKINGENGAKVNGSYMNSMRSCSFLRVKITLCLFSKLDRWKKLSFLLLDPTKSYVINWDHFTHFYSFRNLTVQGKGQASESNAKDLHLPIVLSRVYFSIILLWCLLLCSPKPLWLGF